MNYSIDSTEQHYDTILLYNQKLLMEVLEMGKDLLG